MDLDPEKVEKALREMLEEYIKKRKNEGARLYEISHELRIDEPTPQKPNDASLLKQFRKAGRWRTEHFLKFYQKFGFKQPHHLLEEAIRKASEKK